jgi:DUF1365 family protein
MIIHSEKKNLRSMLMVNGEVINYKNIRVICQATMNLLSIYYVFDRNYPARYGLLLLLE